MKKWTILVALLLCVTLLAGCGDTASEGKKTEDKPEGTTTTTTTETPDATPNTASPSLSITEEQAIAIAAEHFGIAPGTVDEQTGYVMSYQVMQTPTADAPQYKVALQWMVTIDGEPDHQSVLDSVIIDAVSGDVVVDAAPNTASPSLSITEEQAIAIAAEHFGIEPGTVDEQTGYVMSYRVLETATEENPVYKVALQWMVTIDGEPDHQSMLDYVYVDGVDGEVSTEDAE